MSRILHPTLDDIPYTISAMQEMNFYYVKCEVGNLYDKWISIFNEHSDIIFLDDPVILRFTSYRYGYTPFTYKINFSYAPILRDCNDKMEYYTLTENDYKIFSKLFLIDGWEEENISNGEIYKFTKSWVDYLTFQSSRVILQFRFDDYLKSSDLRKEKLQKLNTLYETN